jgi:hypothetical protein
MLSSVNKIIKTIFFVLIIFVLYMLTKVIVNVTLILLKEIIILTILPVIFVSL